jgi:hypothetical protein
MRRRVVLVLTLMIAALVLASGVALAVSKSGGNGDDLLKGTKDRDTLSGGGGDDRIYGKAAGDQLYGDSGADEVYGNRGNDQLFGGQGVDKVFGGPGDDWVNLLDEHGGDVADCGTGVDTVHQDFDDVFPELAERFGGRGCERVIESEATFEGAETAGPQELRARLEGTVVENK